MSNSKHKTVEYEITAFRNNQAKARLSVSQTCQTNEQLNHTLLWDPTEPIATRPLALHKNNQLYTYGWDLNKNITELFNQTAQITASYDYTPYGEIINIFGPLAQENKIRFSSEIHDPELGLIYYNYRHYNPNEGRWISRDPIAERGDMNLYNFIANNPQSYIDALGNKAVDAEVVPDREIDPDKSIESYNCADLAFRDYKWYGEEELLEKLKNDCRKSDKNEKCEGEYCLKIVYYDVKSIKVTLQDGTEEIKLKKDFPHPIFHVVGALGDSTMNACSKNGQSPIEEPGPIDSFHPDLGCNFDIEEKWYCCKCKKNN